MKERFTQRILITGGAMFVVAMVFMAGCTSSTKSGTTITQYPWRNLETKFDAPLAKVHRTAVAVLRDELGYAIEKEAHDALEGVIIAKTAKDYEVKLETYQLEGTPTSVTLNSGFFASRDKGAEILNRIESKLGVKPTAASAEK